MKTASNLPDVDRLGGKSDPYAIVSFQGKITFSFFLKCMQFCTRDIL